MSKKHGARRKRRKAARKGRSHGALLGAIAKALDRAERAGVAVRFGHGGVGWSHYGVILPPWQEGAGNAHGWEVRCYREGGFSLPPRADDLDD